MQNAVDKHVIARCFDGDLQGPLTLFGKRWQPYSFKPEQLCLPLNLDALSLPPPGTEVLDDFSQRCFPMRQCAC